MTRASGTRRRRFLRPPPRLGIAAFRTGAAHNRRPGLEQSVHDSLVRGLSCFQDVFAVPPLVIKLDELPRNPPDPGTPAPKDAELEYLIWGSYIGSKEHIELVLILERVDRRELIWSRGITVDKEDLDTIDEKIANECAAPIVLYLERYEEEAWDLTLHSQEEQLFRTAQSLMSRRTLTALDQARRLLKGIVTRGGEIGEVYVALARAEHSHGLLLAGQRFVEALEQARIYARNAIELNGLNARAHAELALQEMFLKRHVVAEEVYRRALNLNPYDPLLWADWAGCLALMGKAEEALPILQKAAWGWPRDKVWVEWNLCDAEWALNRPHRIIEILASQPDVPHVHRYLAASHAKLGDMAKARHHAVRVRHYQPNFSAKKWRKMLPWQEDLADDYTDCLAKAGL